MRKSITIDEIKKAVCDHFDLQPGDMASDARQEHIALPRQIAMALCRELTLKSYHQIAEASGKDQHGTVIHACRKIAAHAQNDRRIRAAVDDIKAALLAERQPSTGTGAEEAADEPPDDVPFLIHETESILQAAGGHQANSKS